MSDVSPERPAPDALPDTTPAAEAPPRRRSWLRRLARLAFFLFVGYYVLCVLLLVAYRFVNPPITGLQLQRHAEALVHGERLQARRRWRSLEDISRHAPRAVVAAEDGRFWSHAGFDLEAMRDAAGEAIERGRMRGASTITQQLMKNLFGCACRNPIRKVYDLTLTPVAHVVLGRERILELYLNHVEWGKGVFGIDAAARQHYGVSAGRLSRTQAAGLAALLPNPRARTPRNTPIYRREILRRMSVRGW